MYFTAEEIQKEKGVLEDAWEMSATGDEYGHGYDLQKDQVYQNDCSSIISVLLSGQSIISSSVGLTTVEVGGKTFSYYTPNQFGKDLEALGYRSVVNPNKSDDYFEMTTEKSDEFVKQQIIKVLKKNNIPIPSASSASENASPAPVSN